MTNEKIYNVVDLSTCKKFVEISAASAIEALTEAYRIAALEYERARAHFVCAGVAFERRSRVYYERLRLAAYDDAQLVALDRFYGWGVY